MSPGQSPGPKAHASFMSRAFLWPPVRFYVQLEMETRTRRCALWAPVCLFLWMATARTFDLTLLHTNDNHARIEETGEDSGKCSARGPCFAGVARRFTKVSEVRGKEKNVLFLDAGDQFQGTVWFNYYKGAEAAYFMNKLGYDAMVKSCFVVSLCDFWDFFFFIFYWAIFKLEPT